MTVRSSTPTERAEPARATLAAIDDAQRAVHGVLPRWASIRPSQIAAITLYCVVGAHLWAGRTIPDPAIVFGAAVFIGAISFAVEYRVDRASRGGDVVGGTRWPRTGRSTYLAPSVAVAVYITSLVVAGVTGWWWLGFPMAAVALGCALAVARSWHAAYAADRNVQPRRIRTFGARAPAASFDAFVDHSEALRMMAVLIVITKIRLPALRDLLGASPEAAASTANELRTAGFLVVDDVDHERGRWISASREGRRAFAAAVRTLEATVTAR